MLTLSGFHVVTCFIMLLINGAGTIKMDTEILKLTKRQKKTKLLLFGYFKLTLGLPPQSESYSVI